jgi:hypothetical protein
VDPVYDPAYFENLAGRLYGLVISFSDRLPADQAQWLHHVVDVGEYGLALEDLAAMLTYGKIAISDQERGDDDNQRTMTHLGGGNRMPDPRDYARSTVFH